MNDFIFLANWYDVIKAYEDAGQTDMANSIAREIINYGVTGYIKTTDPLICGLVKGMCAKPKSKVGRPSKYSQDKIITLHKQQHSDNDIAKQLGCSVKTIQRALAETDLDDEIQKGVQQ